MALDHPMDPIHNDFRHPIKFRHSARKIYLYGKGTLKAYIKEIDFKFSESRLWILVDGLCAQEQRLEEFENELVSMGMSAVRLY